MIHIALLEIFLKFFLQLLKMIRVELLYNLELFILKAILIIEYLG